MDLVKAAFLHLKHKWENLKGYSLKNIIKVNVGFKPQQIICAVVSRPQCMTWYWSVWSFPKAMRILLKKFPPASWGCLVLWMAWDGGCLTVHVLQFSRDRCLVYAFPPSYKLWPFWLYSWGNKSKVISWTSHSYQVLKLRYRLIYLIPEHLTTIFFSWYLITS